MTCSGLQRRGRAYWRKDSFTTSSACRPRNIRLSLRLAGVSCVTADRVSSGRLPGRRSVRVPEDLHHRLVGEPALARRRAFSERHRLTLELVRGTTGGSVASWLSMHGRWKVDLMPLETGWIVMVGCASMDVGHAVEHAFTAWCAVARGRD